MRRISLHIWFTLITALFLWKIAPGISLASQSSLCESTDMPCKRENPDACQMKYYKLNSTECRDMPFDVKVQSRSGTSDSLGDVELKSFYYNILSYKMTAFNVSFTNIKWTHLKFRFKQIGNDMKNTCREFFIQSNATISEMFYDCIWSNETYEGKPFFFEYEASNDVMKEYKKLSFHVPYAKNVDESLTNARVWETFSLVEAVSVSNGLGPTMFFLNWQPLPEKFSVDTYNISVMSNDTGSLKLIHSINITCKRIKDCNYVYNKWYGTLQFGIQPICKNTLCLTTTSLFFQVGGERAKPLLIGIICATFFVPIALYAVYMVIKYVAMKEVAVMKTISKVLIIHSSSISAHANVVMNLVDYLSNYCSIEPMVDELHIFSSKTRDPFKWCSESFKSADCVMVVASPSFKQKVSPNSVYQKTDILQLRLLRERLATNHGKTKCFVLMLPYNTEQDIPAEAENLRRFHFPRDLNKILRYIHENSVMPNLFKCEMRGGKKDFILHGKKLSIAIEEAQQYLKSNKLERDASMEQEVEVDEHKLLTRKCRDASHFFDGKCRRSQKIVVEDNFLDYPGNLESINLLGEEIDDGEHVTDFELGADCKKIVVSELNL